MSKLHKSQYTATKKLEPNEGQRGLLCSNNVSVRCPSLSFRSLSNDTLEALDDLGNVLKGIRKRMISEGYKITDGVVHKCI